MTSGLSNRGQVTASERRAEDIVVGARAAIADLLGCDAGGVVFGRSMTQLTFDLARALAKSWQPGDEIVVTRLDHDGNVRPWKRVADALGITVRWVDFDRDSAELSFDPGVLSREDPAGRRDRRLQPAGHPSGHRGGSLPRCTRPARMLFVDGVHLTPHAPVSVARPRRGLLRLLALQVLRPAPRRAGGRSRAARAGAPRQAAALDRRRARSGSSSARCPTRCSPASPRRSTSSRTSPRRGRRAARPGAGVDAAGGGLRGPCCSSGCSRGSTPSTGCAATAAPPVVRRRCCSRSRGAPAARCTRGSRRAA